MSNLSFRTDIKKVAVIGPECTGKSELSGYLANHFQTEWVPEYARGFLENLPRPYTEEDLLTIAHGQMRLEDTYLRSARNVLICDTNLYVIKIWSLFKFKHCHADILNNIATRKYDLYLLTAVDLPWEEDPQREHPNQREELYELYLHEMKNQATPFLEIKGEREQRRNTAREAVKKILGSS